MVSFTLDGRTEYWLYLQHGVDISAETQVPSHFGFHLMFLRHRPLCLSGLLSICLSVFIEDPVNLNSLIYFVYTCLCPVSNPPLLISNLIQCLAYQLDLHGEAKWHSKPRSCNCRVDAKYRWYYLDLASPRLCLPFLGLTYAVMLRGYARQAQEGAYYLSVQIGRESCRERV